MNSEERPKKPLSVPMPVPERYDWECFLPKRIIVGQIPMIVERLLLIVVWISLFSLIAALISKVLWALEGLTIEEINS